MARSRGAANRALYHARIVLDAWDRARGERLDEGALCEAFLPAVRLHLRAAYGWYLLSVSGIEESSATPPVSTSDLPAPEAGKARPPELTEFAQLESHGWLAAMLADEAAVDKSTAAGGRSEGLLVSDRQRPGFAVAQAWAQQLGAIMDRMDDSLAEC